MPKDTREFIKKYFWLLIISVTLFVLFLVTSNDYFPNVRFKYFTDDKDVQATKSNKDYSMKACVIPRLNPWDSSIMHMVKHPQGLDCDTVQRFMTYVDHHGNLHLNETELKNLQDSNHSFTCHYRTFDRKAGLDDNAIQYDEKVRLKKSVKLTKDTVDVKCTYNDGDEFYWNVHAHPVRTEERIFAEPTEGQLSVLVFMIDSVSYSAMKRNLPRTYDYTKNNMGVKYFKALNKVGDNSFPNQMAMFLGKNTYDAEKDMPNEVHYNGSTYFDAWPFIWKMFSAKGYATAFSEDMPKYGLFHYYSKGFMKKPFDFYYHNFWKVITEGYVPGQSSRCFGNNHRAMITIDLAKRHMISMSDKLQFLYSTLSELPHDLDNRIEEADNDLLSFWKELFEGGYLNKTFVVFASDHGIRHGVIRKTPIGMIEERLPFYGLWFPSWFYKRYPVLKENIEDNTEMLSSSFDVYETLKDVLDSKFDDSQRKFNSRGQSQLYPLPRNRTCKSAGIPSIFCTCQKSTYLAPNLNISTDAAEAFVSHLNFILKNLSNICQKIKLSKIVFIYQLDDDIVRSRTNNSTRNGFQIGQKLQIGIETEPNNATFETLLKLVDVDKVLQKYIWVIDGAISRTSKYAGLSDCVNDKELRKYCSCKT